MYFAIHYTDRKPVKTEKLPKQKLHSATQFEKNFITDTQILLEFTK